MPTNTLTDAQCRAARPGEKPVKMFDGGGLHLYVSPKGARVWRLAYRLGGRAQTMSFGPYPEVSLAEARRRRDEARQVLRDGGDPMAPRRARQSLTLREAAEAYWGSRRDITDDYRRNVLSCLEQHVLPALGGRAIATVTRSDLLAELNKMADAGLLDYVRKARLWVSKVFAWAIEQEHCDANPAAAIDPETAFPRKTEEHFAAVDLHEVGDLLKRLALEDQSLQSVLACRFLAYTWARTTEARMMTWDEWPGEGDTWVINAGRMKRRRDHLVPLPRQAVEILKAMKARGRGSRFVFPGDRSLDRPMSENAVLYLLHRVGYKGRMTGHGWRSVGSTWANQAGYNPDAVEMQLAHVSMGKTRAAYNRARYLDERRRMLQDWADWLDAQDLV
ncbi:MAG: integrase arm-type DNA-binding domain-containing protein [Aquabacterium sp.]|nr:integrase arm-type DNA-binding domain-containing protein [Aquabacterium sp.]